MMLDLFKRWRWAVLIGAILASGLLFALWPEAMPVDIGKVTRGPMEVGVTDDGVTRAKEYYVVSAPVTGYLTRIELEAGDAVAQGDLITTMRGSPSAPLDPNTTAELRAALAAARASEAGASSELAQSRRDLARAESLANRGFLSKAQLEAARTRVSTDKASLGTARADAAGIAAQLARSSGRPAGPPIAVRAPASGSVMNVITESEGEIPQGTQLMTIGDPRKIEVVIDLLSREAVRVKSGDRVEITQWGGPDPIAAHVKRVEPFGKLKISALGIEEQRVNVIIGFDDPARAAKLGHGYQVDGTIILWRSGKALRVPIGALFRGENGAWHVFVADSGRARAREVKLGHVNDEFGEVLGGLAEDESVILNPAQDIDDGSRVSER